MWVLGDRPSSRVFVDMVARDGGLLEPRPHSKQGDGEQAPEVLQSVSLNGNDGGGRGIAENGTPTSITRGKQSKTREVPCGYKAATVSSANAAAITALRYQSPTRGRSQSPNFGRRSLDAAPKAAPPDKRPTSAERHRPWPSSACENRTPTTLHVLNSPRSVARRPAARSLSSSIQSDTSLSSLSNDGAREQHSLQVGILRHSEGGRAPTTLENGKAWNSSTKLAEAKVASMRKRSPLQSPLLATEQSENSKPVSTSLTAKPGMRRWHSMGNRKPVLSRSVDFGFGRDDSQSNSRSFLGKSASREDKAASNGCLLSRSANEGPNSKLRCIHTNPGNGRLSQSHYVNGDAAEGSLLRTNSVEDNGSDTESSSSGGLSIASFGVNARPKATMVPARFWQDAASIVSVRSLKVPGSTCSLTPGRATQSGQSTPQHPSSPSSQARPLQTLSSSRGWASPTKTRAGQPILMSQLSLNGRRSNVTGLLSLNFESRKNKQAVGHQDDAHDLRLLHNRWLQWRFVNAQTELAMSMQAGKAQCLLYNCFLRTFELRMSVETKQTERNKLWQTEKLGSVLTASAVELNEWELLWPGHGSSLKGLTDALEATVVRVPLIGGPKIDVKAIKENFLSAIEIMDGVEAAINKFLQKAEAADALLSELLKAIAEEKTCLLECGDLMAAVGVLEMEERSLRAGLLQHGLETTMA